MRGLNDLQPAASLIECVVASVIWMFTLVLALEILTRVSLKQVDEVTDGMMLMEVRRCYREYASKPHAVGNEVVDFVWGKMYVQLKPYRGRIQCLVLKAVDCRTGMSIKCRYLVNTDEYEK